MGGEADFSELTTSGERCIASLSRLSLRVGQPAVTPEWILIDAITTVEVHVDGAIDALVANSRVAENPLGKALLVKLGEDMSKSWPARYDWLSDGFGVKIRSEGFVRAFDVVVDCRNAIVHGSGNLTKRQRSSFTKFTELRRRLHTVLDVTVHGTQLLLSESSAERSLSVSREFVHGFDHAVRPHTSRDF